MTTVLLVHGAWHGDWCWHKVEAGLAARGVPTVAITMPLAGLDADADAARAALEAIDDDVVVCGHSYGGFVISRMTTPDAAPTNARHLVYLCAFMSPEGTDAIGLIAEHGSELLPGLHVTERGLEVRDDVLVPALYADCSAEDIALARASLRPMPADEVPPAPVRPGYTHLPATYVVCTDDRAIPAGAQRLMATNASTVVEWPTSHSPFLSAPERVVDLLAGLAS